ncbi:MAG: DinB family protein [Acidimicrobiales bacterium]
MAACDECGLDYEAMPVDEAVVAIRGFGRRYRAPLTRLLAGEDDSILRVRPAPATWSALEYATHVRDVFERYAGWVGVMLAEERPALEGLPPDELVVAGAYNTQSPTVVVEELANRAEALAATFESVPDDGWHRVGTRRGQQPSVELLARRAVHEGSHHLLDIGRGLRAVRAGSPATGSGG